MLSSPLSIFATLVQIDTYTYKPGQNYDTILGLPLISLLFGGYKEQLLS